jgi:hypothetical protein
MTAFAAEGTAQTALPLTCEQGRRTNLYLWILLAVTNLIDLLATGRAFEFGIDELNPLVNQLHAGFGMSGIGLLKATFLTLLYFLLPHVRTWTRALFVLACGIYVALTLAHIWYLAPLL